MNHYANKKSAAESMLDIALLLANASQLKAVIEQGPGFAFFIPLVVLISISLMLQIGVGVLLIFLGACLGRGPQQWEGPGVPLPHGQLILPARTLGCVTYPTECFPGPHRAARRPRPFSLGTWSKM